MRRFRLRKPKSLLHERPGKLNYGLLARLDRLKKRQRALPEKPRKQRNGLRERQKWLYSGPNKRK